MKRLACTAALAAWLTTTAVAFADYEQQEARAEELLEEAEDHAPAHGGQLHLSDLANWEMLGAFFNFGVLMLILGWVIKTKGNPALAARRADVEKELAEAQRLRSEAEARQAEIAARLARLDDEMAQIRSDMIKAGEVERDRIVSQAEEKAARLRKDVSFRIDQQMKQLRIELTTEAASAAVSAAQAILEERTTDADQDELAEAYLARLDEVVQERSS
ncbi:MAG: ATP synthase F0 subunit B [Polyangiales bacterium]